MGVRISPLKDFTTKSGPGKVTIGSDGRVSVRYAPTLLPTVSIRIYGRTSFDFPPSFNRIDYSTDGSNWTTITNLTFTSDDDPLYTLGATFTGPYTDVWVRPFHPDDILLNSDIQSANSVDPGDYIYTKLNPYQYSSHNGVSITTNVDLYFQVAFI